MWKNSIGGPTKWGSWDRLRDSAELLYSLVKRNGKSPPMGGNPGINQGESNDVAGLIDRDRRFFMNKFLMRKEVLSASNVVDVHIRILRRKIDPTRSRNVTSASLIGPMKW